MVKTAKKQTRRELSLDKIAAAATQILTEKGESALTMRAVAQACGVSAMALYHHVGDKDELAGHVVDAIFLAAARVSQGRRTNWRDDALALWLDIRAGLIANPGAGTIFVRRAVVGPGTALTTEEAFRILSASGADNAAVVEATDALTMLLIGSVANELTRPARVRDGLARQMPADELPHLSAMVDAYSDRDPRARFVTAMNWILDGLANRV